ncbi:hypothetical protein E8L99_19225 [Phreatobacter aquaticus]|uniref:Uncharacterized protein n=1 Tax=Phreatobacter aquaticus TaxID=2570229 RepID=A0A4D7QPA5_9HYPH|nr:hypothetical protein [Phreatobacter aquaticus]QCK87733.1 hypothetical protein E8L99_19225 [Phreatobacter aquaticus]
MAFALATGEARSLDAGRPLGDITDVRVLQALEERGFGFGRTFEVTSTGSNEALSRGSEAYRRIVQTVTADVGALRAEMAATGRRLYEITDGNVGRVFELAWLTSPSARFRLVGLVTRFDRRDFADDPASCGEVRLIYRLAYRIERGGRALASRMPFSVNVVHDLGKPAEGTCADVVRRFAPDAGGASPAGQAAWLANSPLAGLALRPKQIEINAQIVRFPSGQETTFGGQAAYLMRIFGVEAGTSAVRLYEKVLENTPDVARLQADAALRGQLAAFLTERAGDVDRGVFVVPERFLATKVISYSTYGSARLANKPYTQLFGAAGQALAGSTGALAFARSGPAFLERLDTATCQGCHQSNATAGFHVIGEDDPTISPLNRVLVGVSPHFAAERPRRAAYAEAILAGREPNRFRPLPMAPPADWSAAPAYRQATLGQTCMPDATRRQFGAGWTCGPGASCVSLSSNDAVGLEFGQCLTTEKRAEYSGQACLAGRIQTVSAAQPWRDRFTVTAQLNSRATAINFRDHTCRPPVGGAPAGLAYRKCTDEDRRFSGFRPGQPAPNEICGFAGGRAFDICVASNDFASCLGDSIVRGMRATCSAERMCREDFMCQALPADLPDVGKVAGLGYCSPTYFLFQMRLDGHPDPRPSATAQPAGSPRRTGAGR